MKKIENYGVQELSISQVKEINGGGFWDLIGDAWRVFNGSYGKARYSE
ncbi:hypothetical protein T190115A13A_10158 [Tenacibaculum sp. 190524A02b]|uniref:Bacteriocin-type signal sequence n=1 Tax=Tenacibaculum vairaonense TaxID=3137860 RepID=A0ABP1F6G8_9FLAO